VSTLQEVQRGISVLFEPGDVVEVRVPKTRFGTISGYFNDHVAMANAIVELSKGGHNGVYYTLNQIQSELLARTDNKIVNKAEVTTNDAQVTRRRWLLIDVDPVRPAGISSSEAEKTASLYVAQDVVKYLVQQEWMIPTSADSGNGTHLLYRLDLENTKEVTETIKAVLNNLADMFDTDSVKIDRSVFNAARITKAYGSLCCKGANTTDRPHRNSKIRVAKEDKTVVTLEQLNALAQKTTQLPQTSSASASSVKQLDKIEALEAFMDFYGIKYTETMETSGGVKWQLDECPFNPEHKKPDSVMFLYENGAKGFKCLHNSCSDNHWIELRTKMEIETGKKFNFQSQQGMDYVPPTGTSAGITEAMWTTINSVQAVALQWLWKNRIPLRCNTAFAGDPSTAKTTFALDLIARGSRGDVFLDGTPNTLGVFESILLSSEDDPETVLKPRLMAMCADTTKIHILTSIKVKNGTEESERALRFDTDMLLIRQKLVACPGIRLVVIDPMSNYCGAKNINREQEIRDIMMPLAKMAQELNVSVISIFHNSKTEGRSAMHKVIGAVGNVGTARMGWSFMKDPANPDVKLMLQMKENLGKFPGISFTTVGKDITIDNQPVEQATIKYLSASAVEANDLIIQNESYVQKSNSSLESVLTRVFPFGTEMSAEDGYTKLSEMGIDLDPDSEKDRAKLYRVRIKLGIQTENRKGVWFWIREIPTETDYNSIIRTSISVPMEASL